MSAEPDQAAAAPRSATADALAAAGDVRSAQDIGALDDAAAGVDRKLAPTRPGLVERLIYGPLPPVAELQAGARLARQLELDTPARARGVVDEALATLAAGEAFTADGKLSEAIRGRVAGAGAFGYTVPATYGGLDGSYLELAGIEERLAAHGLGPLAVEVSGQLTIGAGSLLGYGSEQQRSTFLPLISTGKPMGFALTEVGVGVNAKKIQAYVKEDANGDYRLFAEGACNKLWITNARHGALLGVVARVGRDGEQIGLFVLELPPEDMGGKDHDSGDGRGSTAAAEAGVEFRCSPSGVAAFTQNYNSRLHFRNFPIPKANRIPAEGVEVLFYCLRMGRCMLAAMAAGYQRMLARDASYYALRRVGVGGPVIRHELPRLALGRMLGGSLQAKSLAFLSLQQDADGADLAGLRDLTKSASASIGLESMIACEHVMGGRAFDGASRVNAARVNLHLFGVVEGEDDMIRMGMVRDVMLPFVRRYLAPLLDVIRETNTRADGSQVAESERLLSIGPASFATAPARSIAAVGRLLRRAGFWRLAGWVLVNAAADLLRLPGRFVPASFLSRYASLPPELRWFARFAERRLRGLRWKYLALSLVYQLELTRAQIPLQRFGLCIEHLTSILALCHHASVFDESQQEVALLQAQVLKDRLDGIKLLGSPRDLARLRRATGRVGARIAAEEQSLFADLPAEPFAHPWSKDRTSDEDGRGNS